MTLALACGAAAAPGWRQPVQLSVRDRALGPELAVNRAGDAAVAWDQEVGSVCATQPAALECVHVVTVASRTRGASSWQAPLDVARPGIGAAPQVALDSSGDAAIAWVHDIGRDRVLQATIRHGVAGAWPNPNDLSDSVLQVRNQRIALDDAGDAIVVWAQRVATSFTVHAEVRPAAAGVWGSATPLSSSGANATGGPALAVTPGGHGLAAWIEDGVVRVSDGDGATRSWTPALTLSAAEGEPAVAVDRAGDAAVVWRRGAQAEAAFRAATGIWGAPVVLGSASGDPQVAIDDAGNAVAAWLAGTTLRSAARTRDGPWSPPVDIAAGASEPRVSTTASGNTVAVWTSTTDGVIEAALRPAASGVWQPSLAVSQPGASTPRVAGSVLAWNRAVSVETSELTGGGPLLSRLRVPKRAVARTRVTFGVEAVPWEAGIAGGPVWRFGDGRSATGTRVRHAYRKPGRYTVSVTATDATGETTTASATIAIRRRPRR